MQQQKQNSGADAHATAAVQPMHIPAGSRIALGNLAAGSMGDDRSFAVPMPLVPFQFAAKLSGEVPAIGSVFAESGLQAKLEAQLVIESAWTMMSYMMPGMAAAPLARYPTHVKPRPLPLMVPNMFDFGIRGPSHAGDIIVSGPCFFGAPSPPPSIVRPENVRAAMRESRADDLIRRIIATDPAVRQAWLMGREISWPLIVGYTPGVRPIARAALHVLAEDEALALQPCTIAATLCVLLGTNNYKRRHGMTFHRTGMLAPMPNAASVRAALKQAHCRHDERLSREVTTALSYLRRAGLNNLARQIEAQAMAALPAGVP